MFIALLSPALVHQACMPDAPGLDQVWDDHVADETHDDWSDIETPPQNDPSAPADGTQAPGQDAPSDDGEGDADATGSSAGAPEGGASSTTGEHLPSVGGLRIVEIMPDPEGADGHPDGPEFVELLNTDDASLQLDALQLIVRSWPRLDATDLGLTGQELAPGQLLLIRRFSAGASTGGAAQLVDGALVTSFTTSSGMKNADGGVLLVDAADNDVDLVIYGAAQDAPHDDPSSWGGDPAPAPGSGQSLCREDPTLDTNAARDWSLCLPTPGSVPAVGDGGDGDDSEGDSDTGAGPEGDGGIGSEGEAEAGSGSEASAETGSEMGGTEAEEPGAGNGDTGDTGDTGNTSQASQASGHIVIVEVLSNAPGPSSDEKRFEYVEILNADTLSIRLDGWTIADDANPAASGIDPLLPLTGDGGCGSAACLAPGFRAIIVGNTYAGPLGNGLVLVVDDTTLADGGLTSAEPVVLRDSAGSIISTYRVWDDPKAAPYPLSEENPVVRTDPDAPDEPMSWTFGVSTPGDDSP
ncbi:MAG: lamin tail domain-containing protein [Nannocystaceae bacterium]